MKMNLMKVLPIGIQTFAKIREDDRCYYVDKTKHIVDLSQNGSCYFLSRPRRFGKSLFLDTLREAFIGNKELFKGLYIENNWDWSKKHPVIRIDFGTGHLRTAPELDQRILEILNEHAVKDSVSFQNESISGKFRELIIMLQEKYSEKVVVLIDEYDKPILDNITDKPLAREMRDGLRNLYSAIKGADAYIQFVFVTGVSKFSKVNLFSGLNNLEDITLNENFASICGYTESELSVFEERMQNVNREHLRLWYNGYNFLGESVFNPFDILFFLKSQRFENYWCETGNPAFLIDLIKEKKYNPIQIESVKLTKEEMNSFDVDSIELEVLLFQTGYLTIKEYQYSPEYSYYTLKYPNLEVRRSLSANILDALHGSTLTEKTGFKNQMREAIRIGDPAEIKNALHSFYASIPHSWYRKNPIAKYEGYYSALFYCYLNALGFDARAEVPTNKGQADLTLFSGNNLFIFEFKIMEIAGKGSALQQIKKKKYYEKYIFERSSDAIDFNERTGLRPIPTEKIFLIGIEFSQKEKNIIHFEWETAPDGLIDPETIIS